MRVRTAWIVAAAALALGSIAGPAFAQDAAVAVEEGPALEFRANVPWARVVLEGDPSVAGRSPLRVPGPLAGSLWLYAAGPGLEEQRGKVHIVLDENGSHIASYGALRFGPTMMRALLYPGFAQWQAQERSKAKTMIFAATTGLAFSLWAHDDYRGALDRRESAEADLAAAPDSTLPAVRESLRGARAEEGHLRDRRDLALAATGVVWGVSLVDAVLFRPRFDVTEADETSLTVSLRRKWRGQAIARSLFFPGLGQEYNGQRRKAFWVAMGGLAAGSYTAWRMDDVARAEARLRQAEDRLQELDTPENQALRDKSQGDVDQTRNERDTAFKILAGYWGLSLLDAALSFESPWGDVPVGSPHSSLHWRVDPARGVLAGELRF
jgi:hypothetical protein